MKRFLLTFGLIIIISKGIFALSGGPDLFGYTWKDSNEPNGPVYQWIDIVTSDRKVHGLADDNVVGPFVMMHGSSAYFKFYWMQIDKFWVGSNGYISFGNCFLASLFPNIPDSTDTRHHFIAGFLADLTFSGVGNQGACYYKDTWDSLIVSYINVPFYYQFAPSYTGYNTFQIILNKIDYSITVNFLNHNGTSTDGDVRTGIENLTGNIGLQPFSYTYPAAGYSIRYYYPANPSYYVTDGSTIWNSFDGSGGLFLPYPTTYSLQSLIANTGNRDIVPPYTSTARVKNFSGTSLLTETKTLIDSLFIYADSLIQYSSIFAPPAAGIYSFTNHIASVTGDNIHSNDSITQELVAIDTSQLIMELNYSDNAPDAPGISWVDGTGGLGYYFVPPYYPCKIMATRFYIESNANGANFIAKILDDDGWNNSPGTLLDSTAFGGTVFVGGYNTVIPQNPIVIYNGGVYVGWEMFGTGITLARDITPPISFRTYEFISGVWSGYRQSESEDFLITCSVRKHLFEDVGTPHIVAPMSDSIGDSAVAVSVWLKNYGQQAESSFIVNYQAWYHPVVTQNYTGAPIQPGDSVLFTFATPLQDSSQIAGTLCAWTRKLNDYDPHNDTSCKWLQVVPVDTSHIGLAEVPQPTMGIYPNPSTSSAIIRFDNPDHQPYTLNVYNIQGRLVYTVGEIVGDKTYLSGEILKPGVYIAEIKGAYVLRSKFVMLAK